MQSACLAFLLLWPLTGAAQDSLPGEAPPVAQEQTKPAPLPRDRDVDLNSLKSLLFTHWQHTAIIDARRSRGFVKPPTESELNENLAIPGEEIPKPPPEEREISLGGIAFISADDWTIWLNGQRVTPKAIPKEVLDLTVYGEYIEVKWFDEYSNQIFPLRLRPHQRFNIDSRIFLPG